MQSAQYDWFSAVWFISKSHHFLFKWNAIQQNKMQNKQFLLNHISVNKTREFERENKEKDIALTLYKLLFFFTFKEILTVETIFSFIKPYVPFLIIWSDDMQNRFNENWLFEHFVRFLLSFLHFNLIHYFFKRNSGWFSVSDSTMQNCVMGQHVLPLWKFWGAIDWFIISTFLYIYTS